MMAANKKKPYEYIAFISYKREDENLAKWLQNKLESYRFPTNLNGLTNLPKRIRPIFRDVTDLTPGVLVEEINNALVKSKWLIVICSPRSAKSEWVCKEAQAFIDLGRSDYIIPFIIEGFPNSKDATTECYPKALLELIPNKELLASNINEMGRNAAAIKVIARMFGLKFNTLWQRFERQRKKRLLSIIIVAILAILMAIGTTFLYFDRNKAYYSLAKSNDELMTANANLDSTRYCLEISNQRLHQSLRIIEHSNDSLNELNKQIIESNTLLSIERDKVNVQKNEILQQQMQIVAQIAESMYDEGRVLPSYRKIKPYITNIINGNYPYSPEIASLLNKIKWHLSSKGYKIIDIAKNTSDVYDIKENGDVIFSQDSIYVSANLRYNLYASEYGKYYIYDFHTSNEFLIYEGRVDDCDFQIGGDYIYFGYSEGMHLMEITTHDIINNVYGEEVLEYRPPFTKERALELNVKLEQSQNIQIERIFEDIPDLSSNRSIRANEDYKELLCGNKLFTNREIKYNYEYENSFEINQALDLQSHISTTETIEGIEYKICDEYLDYKLYLPNEYYNEDYLLKNNNCDTIIFNPFIVYSLGNAVPVPYWGYIIDRENILCVASESEPMMYNLTSKRVSEMQRINIDTWENGHIGAYVTFSTLFDNRKTLCQVMACGQIILWDIESGKIIDEYDLTLRALINNVVKIDNGTLFLMTDNNKQYLFKIPDKYESMTEDYNAINSFWD